MTVPHDPPSLAALGSVLRTFREKRGLTQEAVGSAAKVSRFYVSDTERGNRNPTYAVLGRLLWALGLTWAEFGAALDQQDRGRHRASRRDGGGATL